MLSMHSIYLQSGPGLELKRVETEQAALVHCNDRKHQQAENG